MYEPRYVITHQLLKNIGSIEAAREVVDNAALVPQWEVTFREEAMNRTVHHGTHLEGNELSREQAERVIVLKEIHAEPAAAKAGIVGRDRDVQEVINYRRVMEWIDQLGVRGRDSMVINEKLLKDVHAMTSYRILPVEERGAYRTVPVVVKSSKTGEVSFRPPQQIEVPYQVEEFFDWFNSESGRQHHSIIRAGISHYELVRIHPFTDGNGRVARAMALLVLYSEGYDVKRFFSIEEYFDKHPSEYYEGLRSVDAEDGYDLTYWLEFFTHTLSIELDKVKQQVLKLSRDVKLKADLGKQVALSERQITILETMQRNGGQVVSADLEDALPMVSIDTILRDLKSLMEKALIKKRGRTKGAYYELL